MARELVFQWDPLKARSYLAKHGITFAEASTFIVMMQASCWPPPTIHRARTVGSCWGIANHHACWWSFILRSPNGLSA
jgi:uncharacterized DUF497 family protein